MDFDVIITGDNRVVARFDEWPAELHDALYARISQLTNILKARVLALAPQRTGRLKDEIIAVVADRPKRIEGLVTLKADTGNEYAKAGALEYGAHGGGRSRPRVKAYKRTITEAFGRDISPTRINVRSYKRTPNIEERAFFRGGLAAVKAEATAELQQLIDQSAKEF